MMKILAFPLTQLAILRPAAEKNFRQADKKALVSSQPANNQALVWAISGIGPLHASREAVFQCACFLLQRQ